MRADAATGGAVERERARLAALRRQGARRLLEFDAALRVLEACAADLRHVCAEMAAGQAPTPERRPDAEARPGGAGARP